MRYKVPLAHYKNDRSQWKVPIIIEKQVCARCASTVHCVPLSCSGFLQAQNRQIDRRGGQEGKGREVRGREECKLWMTGFSSQQNSSENLLYLSGKCPPFPDLCNNVLVQICSHHIHTKPTRMKIMYFWLFCERKMSLIICSVTPAVINKFGGLLCPTQETSIHINTCLENPFCLMSVCLLSGIFLIS